MADLYCVCAVTCPMHSAQNKGWKLVGHSYGLSLASPLEMYSKICPIKLDFARSYAEVGRKMTCDRSLF